MYYQWIAIGLQHFGLTMLMLALALSIIEWFFQLFLKRSTLSGILYRWIALLPVGATLIYTAVMYGFYSDVIATSLKWHISPFQFLVGTANLSFGLLAIFSFGASRGFRKATVFAITLWMWSNVGVVINEMVVRSHYHFDDLGSQYWLNLCLPLVLMICLLKTKNIHPKQVQAVKKANLSL